MSKSCRLQKNLLPQQPNHRFPESVDISLSTKFKSLIHFSSSTLNQVASRVCSVVFGWLVRFHNSVILFVSDNARLNLTWFSVIYFLTLNITIQIIYEAYYISSRYTVNIVGTSKTVFFLNFARRL